MTSFDDLLAGEVDDGERESLMRLAERLYRQRPLPAPAFRGELRRSLASAEAGSTLRPRRLWLLVGGYAASGAFLLAFAAVGVAGVGPLAS